MNCIFADVGRVGRPLMRSVVFAVTALAASCALFSSAPSALVVEGSFAGLVDRIQVRGTPTVPQGLTTGDILSGNFHYDTSSTTDVVPGPSFGSYIIGANGSLSFEVNGLTWTSGEHLVANVTDGRFDSLLHPGQHRDAFEIFYSGGASSSPGDPTPADSFGLLSISAETASPSTLTTTDALPESLAQLDLTAATNMEAVVWSTRGPPKNQDPNLYQVFFSIDPASITLGPRLLDVPEANCRPGAQINRCFVAPLKNFPIRDLPVLAKDPPPPSSVKGDGDLVAIFNAAADWWERVLADEDHDLTIYYGWDNLGRPTRPLLPLGWGRAESTDLMGLLPGGAPARIAEGRIRFNNHPDTNFFLDETPADNSEYQRILVTSERFDTSATSSGDETVQYFV